MRYTLDQEKCRSQIVSECAVCARGIGAAGLTVQEGAIPRGFVREVLPGALTLPSREFRHKRTKWVPSLRLSHHDRARVGTEHLA